MAGEERTTFGEGRRALASLGCAVVLGGMAMLFFASGAPPFTWASVLPALLALLLLYNAVHSLLAGQTPPTTLKLRTTLKPGEETEVVIRQGGPVRFHSLRANLICERIERPQPERDRVMSYPCQSNVFDSGACEIREGAVREFSFVLTIPADAEASLESVKLKIRWRLELWGRVRGRADFMRPFDLEILERDP